MISAKGLSPYLATYTYCRLPSNMGIWTASWESDLKIKILKKAKLSCLAFFCF